MNSLKGLKQNHQEVVSIPLFYSIFLSAAKQANIAYAAVLLFLLADWFLKFLVRLRLHRLTGMGIWDVFRKILLFLTKGLILFSLPLAHITDQFVFAAGYPLECLLVVFFLSSIAGNILSNLYILGVPLPECLVLFFGLERPGAKNLK